MVRGEMKRPKTRSEREIVIHRNRKVKKLMKEKHKMKSQQKPDEK